ncbi:hypothetical protein AAEX37_01068 [Oligella sp. MSHR50489EDL]
MKSLCLNQPAIFNKNMMFWLGAIALLSLMLLVPSPAFADAGGFASEAKSMMTSIRDGLQIIVGVVATIALLWQFAEGFMGRKTWADVFITCAWIIGAAVAVALATWIFDKGQGISFG